MCLCRRNFGAYKLVIHNVIRVVEWFYEFKKIKSERPLESLMCPRIASEESLG